MGTSISEKLMYCTVLIKCKYKDGEGNGTGFIFNFLNNGQECVPAIVTNCHVINEAITTEFELCLAKDDGSPDDLHVYSVVADSKFWIRHPHNVDLCCLPIGGIINELRNKGIKVFYIPIDSSVIPNQSVLDSLNAVENLVMVGYPIGLSDTYNHKPVIRRGITSSHLKNNYLGRKEFLIDMACFPGSSGSPIFILNEGFYTQGNSLIPGDQVLFVGILYGGPQYCADGQIVRYAIPNFVTKTYIPANLGYAIKSSEIFSFDEVIKQKLHLE